MSVGARGGSSWVGVLCLQLPACLRSVVYAEVWLVQVVHTNDCFDNAEAVRGHVCVVVEQSGT